jgi:uncharacterized protein YqcC (DUF446 family)
MPSADPERDNRIYTFAAAKADQIEAELKQLNRWEGEPLPPEKLENMGAFGSNTMRFEQWLQFILIPRIREIVETKGEFPETSQLSRYAFRVFQDEPEKEVLHELLFELDQLINGYRENKEQVRPASTADRDNVPRAQFNTSLSNIPPVLFQLAEVLPQFEGDGLESQLQTFDTFLDMLSSELRPAISELLAVAARATMDSVSRERIEKAAADVRNGKRAAAPYDHETAMKKYREDHKKNYKA